MLDNFFDPKYHEIYIPVQIEDINILLSYEQEETVSIIPLINFKFRISSHFLPHNLEFFQIKNLEFFSIVSQFHLPIVRSYYDGNQIYLTPSCNSACMTFINIDYKYFTGKKDPIEIINKYRMRGFGTILNENEINKLVKYSSLVPKWKKLYGLNIKSQKSILNNIGPLKIKDNFFKPSLILYEKEQTTKYENMICDIDYKLIPKNINDIFSLIKIYYNLQNNIFCKLFTINKYGYINIIKKIIINIFNDIDTFGGLLG